jgi:hypothetical protein
MPQKSPHGFKTTTNKRTWSDVSNSSNSSFNDDFYDPPDHDTTTFSSSRRATASSTQTKSSSAATTKTKPNRSSSSGNSTITAGSTYRVILRLAQELRTQKKLTDRRAAGTKLLSMLADAKVRAKLYREAQTSSSRTHSSPKEAIQALWKVVIMNALYAAETSLDGKQRVQLDELMLPYKLLRRSEETTATTTTTAEGSTTATTTTTTTGKEGDETIPSTSEGSHNYHPNLMLSSSYTAGVLSGNEILDLFNFCMKLLNEEQALEIAQMDSLEMLNHLCSQPQYVVSYNKKNDTYIITVAFF